MRKITVVMAVLLAAACGSKSSTPGGPGGGGTGPTEPAPGPLAAGQWETMDHEARADFMSKAVLPAMAEKFKAFDPDRFGDFDCVTCHGDGANDHSFKMPNPDLDALSMDEIQNPDADHKAITEFMMTTVKPTVANLLGKPEYSAENPQGFGCFNCHTMKE
jgi:hypothetical protein